MLREREDDLWPRSGDPPAAGTPAAGPGAEVKAGHGGVPARPLPQERSIWEVMTLPEVGSADTLGDLAMALDASPEFRSAVLVQTLRRARVRLQRCSQHESPATTVAVPLGDLVVATKALLGRLR